MFHEFHGNSSIYSFLQAKCLCLEQVFSRFTKAPLFLSAITAQQAGGKEQRKCSCLNEKVRERKSTLKLNARYVLHLWPKEKAEKRKKLAKNITRILI